MYEQPNFDRQLARLLGTLSRTKLESVQALLLVFSGLFLSAPRALAQTAGRSVVSLRVKVNVVSVVQTGSAYQRNISIFSQQTPTASTGSVLLWARQRESLSLTKEVRKLSESGWESELSAAAAISGATEARGGRRVIAFSKRSGCLKKIRPPASDTVEQSEALILTGIVVPR